LENRRNLGKGRITKEKRRVQTRGWIYVPEKDTGETRKEKVKPAGNKTSRI